MRKMVYSKENVSCRNIRNNALGQIENFMGI